jgi:hypothetical protein
VSDTPIYVRDFTVNATAIYLEKTRQLREFVSLRRRDTILIRRVAGAISLDSDGTLRRRHAKGRMMKYVRGGGSMPPCLPTSRRRTSREKIPTRRRRETGKIGDEADAWACNGCDALLLLLPQPPPLVMQMDAGSNRVG